MNDFKHNHIKSKSNILTRQQKPIVVTEIRMEFIIILKLHRQLWSRISPHRHEVANSFGYIT